MNRQKVDVEDIRPAPNERRNKRSLRNFFWLIEIVFTLDKQAHVKLQNIAVDNTAYADLKCSINPRTVVETL
jgi:hypothetical protein